MGGKRIQKGKDGTASLHISRGQALRKLQLSLANFRRLCIYKGIFPRELKGKGVFHKKDITYISHDPLINHFRQERIFQKRLKKAKNKDDNTLLKSLFERKPQLNLDHVIKERYPTFNDALKDLSDALSFLFTISTLPAIKYISSQIIQESFRLTTEFMNFIIASKSLRKVFISVKGYYFQAQVKNNLVTWIIPHNLVPIIPRDVDFKILKSFAEFYLTFLRFVNCHLFNSLNIVYPPQILGGMDDSLKSSCLSENDLTNLLLSRLTFPLKLINDNSDLLTSDNFTIINDEEETMSFGNVSSLFEGKKFFLSREVPRQPFVFAIRCCGGEVSWEDNCSFGVFFKEDDPSITHHIIDRPTPKELRMGRVYLQPQWIFDSINNCSCLPIENYLPEAELPSHISPFVQEKYPHLFKKLDQDIESLENSDKPNVEMSKKLQKMAYHSLSNKKRKLYDKLQKIRKYRQKEETKLQRKRKLIASKSKVESS